MPRHQSSFVGCVALVGIAVAAFASADPALAPPPTAEQLSFFESKVRPLLVARCYDCHSQEGDTEGGLALDTRAGWQHGGETGPAIVPGKPEESLLIGAIGYENRELQMPPDGKLAPAEIEILTKWVKMGAPDPRDGQAPAPRAAAIDFAEARKFWAFQPVRRPAVPAVKDPSWVRTPIDAFIRVAQEAQGVAAAPPADKRVLIRRATFSLTGLPPTTAEVEAFLADNSPDSFRLLVERLLASPRYGEHWGRHWLDVARYSDSNGMDENMAYAQAYRYRDYVIAAFNHDKPFDRFVTEQIAGDLMPGTHEPNSRRERIIATGFLAIGPKFLAEDDPVKLQMDIVDEQVEATGRAFLGMTFGCARCHDHKIDPIPATDYYALAGIFKSTKTMDTLSVVARWHERPLGSEEEFAAWKEFGKRRDKLQLAINTTLSEANKTLPEDVRKKPAAEQERHFSADVTEKLASLRKELESLVAIGPRLDFAMAVAEAKPGNIRIHFRGSHMTQGPVVSRGIPQVFAGTGETPIGDDQSGRLELARWLASPENPLTARVFVNRVWHWHFGRGIVRSPDYFGKLGEPPTHPELLDWLADEFVRSGWSVKHLHRLILLSSTWQMSGMASPAALAADPDNRLWTRMPRRRLEAEAIRDSILQLAGRLDFSVDGPPLPMKSHERVSSVEAPVNPRLYDTNHRSVYLPVVRSEIYPPLAAFDFPDPTGGVGARDATLVPAQSLFLMNHAFVAEQAKAAAEVVLQSVATDDAERIRSLFMAAYGRPATDDEISRSLAFIGDHEARWARENPAKKNEARKRAWQAVCRAVVAANEFVFVE